MNKLQNIKTFFKEFKYLKKYFFQELNKMTSERLMVEHLAKYSAPLIKEHEYDPKALEKYVEMCEKKPKFKIPIPETSFVEVTLDKDGKPQYNFK